MTEPATPAAAPAAPAASEPAAPASVVKTPAASLLDAGDPNVAPAAVTPPAAPPATPAEAKWYLAEGIPGQGDAPEWLKTDKYKSADEQAKAYPELEKRFGAFKGAPKDGVYQVAIPESIPIQLDTEHPLFGELNTWAAKSQLSQEGYNELIGMFAAYEHANMPDVNMLKSQLGENADARLNSVSQWAKANLSAEQVEVFRESLQTAKAASIFKAFEAVIAKTRAPALPKVDDDVPAAKPNGLDEINFKQANEKDANGQRRYVTDPAWRAELEKQRRAIMASMTT